MRIINKYESRGPTSEDALKARAGRRVRWSPMYSKWVEAETSRGLLHYRDSDSGFRGVCV